MWAIEREALIEGLENIGKGMWFDGTEMDVGDVQKPSWIQR
jgi:hypothetical protein